MRVAMLLQDWLTKDQQMLEDNALPHAQSIVL